MTQVFISYSRDDMEFVQRLAMDLNRLGLDVWWDLSDIRGSDVWERKIEEGLTSSQYFIVVLTPASLESRWVRREYLSADNTGIRIIPLKLKPYDVTPLTLRDIQPIDAVDRRYEDVLSDVLGIVKGTVAGGEEAENRQEIDNVHSKEAPVPEIKESRNPILELLLAKGVRGVDVGGTFPLATYFLLAGLQLLGPGDDAVTVLLAASAALSGIFFLIKKTIPDIAVFRILGIIYLLLYASVIYSEYYGVEIPFVTVIAGVAALLVGILMFATVQRPKKPVYFSAFSFALFLFFVAVNQFSDYSGNYDALNEVPIMYTSVITAILLWRDL